MKKSSLLVLAITALLLVFETGDARPQQIPDQAVDRQQLPDQAVEVEQLPDHGIFEQVPGEATSQQAFDELVALVRAQTRVIQSLAERVEGLEQRVNELETTGEQ